MEHATPPLSSQYQGRRLDFVFAMAFWAMLVLGYLSFVGVRARMLILRLGDIDEVREDSARTPGNFPLPMLDICELSTEGSLLHIISVQASAGYRDPKNDTKTSATNIVKNITLEPQGNSQGSGCRAGRPCPRMAEYNCHRFNAFKKVPEDAEQVDGDFIIRARKDLAVGKTPPAVRLYSGRSNLSMISGFFFRLSLAENMTHPIAFEHEMMRHIGVPIDNGLRIVDVLARPFRYIWRDTLGNRWGAKYPDTWVLDVSQFTRFEPLPEEKDPRVELRYNFASTTVERVEHINTVIMNVVHFLKDCASMTVMFTAMGVLFTAVRKEPVQKRFCLHICGLGSMDPVQEAIPSQKGAVGDVTFFGSDSEPEFVEEPGALPKPGSAAAAELGGAEERAPPE